MLPKNSRLNLKKDFKWIIKGQVQEGELLKLFFRRGSNQGPRLGITTPTKVFKRAVDRNRARRLASAGFEKLFKNLPESINILAIAKKGLLDKKTQDVFEEIKILIADD